VITALQLVLALVLLGGMVWLGGALAGGSDAALVEKKLRDRDA